MSLIIFPNRNQSSNIQNVYNYNNSKVINAENVTDNSITNFYQFPPELFEQTRKLIEETNSSYKKELFDILKKVETAQKTNNKKDCGNWLGQFISLAFIADCVTVIQPIVGLLSLLI